MGYMGGTDRDQITYWSLEDIVAEESMVRVIDKYVDTCDLKNSASPGHILLRRAAPDMRRSRS